MRLYLFFAALALTASLAQAQRAPDRVPSHPLAVQVESSKHQADPNDAELTSHRHYTNKDGHVVHAPAKSTTGQVPAGASAKCRDGTYSFSQHHRGTCSHHGGVEIWL